MSARDINEALVNQTRIQLSDQFSRLEAFRSKSFTTLAASGTLSAFFAARVASVSGGLKIAVIGSFAVTALFAILISWPRTTSQGFGPATYQEWAKEHGAEDGAAEDFFDSLARDVVDAWRKNEPKVTRSGQLFFLQCVALTTQLVTWLVILAQP
jgi:hypothetical protein